MSALTVLVLQAERAVVERVSQPVSQISLARAKSQATAAPGDWRLTDRGIAVILVFAAMILTAAVAVIGLTAVRVTGADYTPDVQSQHDRR
jgi:hypothetical protein